MTANAVRAIRSASLIERRGQVTQCYGLLIEANGPEVFLGERCEILARGQDAPISAEVIGIKEGRVLLMPLSEVHGIRRGSEIRGTGQSLRVPVGTELLGRVVDPFGMPIDDGGAIAASSTYPLISDPLNPLCRKPIHQPLETGVKAVDTLLTLGRGQRIGIFAGSGVGKSTLLGMIARNTSADVNVIALVGERGREVQDFIRRNLGAKGLARSVLVVATSDRPALIRTHAALAATSIAEYFRDQGKQVLLMMDSVTRFAMAQREIGLSIGEPPTSRGYTPSVFAMLPRLMERAGTCSEVGSITALYTVLVEGDDMNDPVADHVRAIVDGHIVLARNIAQEGQYPAIDVLQSISRLAHELRNQEQSTLAQQVVRTLSVVRENKDVIDLGAYQRGTNPELDRALDLLPKLKQFLRQQHSEAVSASRAFATLKSILGPNAGAAVA